MALFTPRDRIAIAVLAGIILAGWGVRLWQHRDAGETVQVIRGAVQPPSPAVPASASAPDSAAAPASSPAAPSAALPVNINRAGAAELDKLPMIGPAKAEAIIRYRVEHGPFARPADIMNVKGIGKGIFSRIETLITVDDRAGKPPERPSVP
jgi:competence protein ComEA